VVLSERCVASRADFFLGALIGLTAFVKNEGQLFALIASVAWIGCVLSRRPDGTLWQSALPFMLGLGLALAPLFYFKLHLAPANDLLSSHPAGRLGQLFAPARHRLILAALWRDLGQFGQWRWLPYFPLLLALVGPGWRRLTRFDWSIAAVLLLTFLGYYVVYLLSPFDLQWHLNSSLVRLLMQLWPSGLFFWGLAAGAEPKAVGASASAEALAKAEGRAPPTWLLITANLTLGVFLLGALNRQLAPNEIAATRFHTVHAVPAADWYPAESDSRDRWFWSSGSSTLHLVSAGKRSVDLHVSLRGFLQAQNIVARVNGRIIWTARVSRLLTKFSIPDVTTPADIIFSSDHPGIAESTDPRSRTLAFALYDLRIE